MILSLYSLIITQYINWIFFIYNFVYFRYELIFCEIPEEPTREQLRLKIKDVDAVLWHPLTGYKLDKELINRAGNNFRLFNFIKIQKKLLITKISLIFIRG